MTGIRVLTLAGPAIALLFTVTFLMIWSHWRDLRYLLWIASAFFLFSIAALSQILSIPSDFGLNAIASCILYLGAVLAFSEGTLRRQGLRSNYLLSILTGLTIISGTVYFFYIDRNLHARIYILNFGLAALLLITALKIGWAARSMIDRALFWILLVFAVQFFPRTILSLGYIGNRRDVTSLIQSPFWIWLNFSFIVFTVLLGLALSGAVVSDVIVALDQRADTDALTGLLNRRGFEAFAERQLLRAEAGPLSLIVFDIDDFKLINDSYGHHAGDVVLMEVSSLVRERVPVSEAVARLGGEEFVVLLRALERDSVYTLSERLREDIAEIRFRTESLRSQSITASFGVVEFQPGESLWHAVQRADKLLYQAKRSGKNKTLVSWMNSEFATLN